jgi:hypothetical protein
MLRRYTFYGGIRRSSTHLDPSKQFGPNATMALSATPTPWYHPPPFVNDIRWWDDFFLKSPRPPPPDKLDFDLNYLVPLKTHGHSHSTLRSTPKFFFGHMHVLDVFSTSSNETLKSSPFLHQHSTFFHHFHLINEET